MMKEKTSMHSSRMRTARLLTVSCSIKGEGVLHPGRGSASGGLGSVLREMWIQGACTWRGLHPGRLGRVPIDANPLGHVTCHKCWEGNLSPSPMNRMTDMCKSITLLQTSFAGGNNWGAEGKWTTELSSVGSIYTCDYYLYDCDCDSVLLNDTNNPM